MKKLRLLVLVVLWSPFSLSAQNSHSPAHRYLEFINHYKSDSLEALLAPDFTITRSYTTLVVDREMFFSFYLPRSEQWHAGYAIVEDLSTGNTKSFIVKDISDYFTFLDIPPPKWKLIILEEGGQVSNVHMDSIGDYAAYNEMCSSQERVFEHWLAEKHPEENFDEVYKDSGTLFIQRLQEFWEDRQN